LRAFFLLIVAQIKNLSTITFFLAFLLPASLSALFLSFFFYPHHISFLEDLGGLDFRDFLEFCFLFFLLLFFCFSCGFLVFGVGGSAVGFSFVLALFVGFGFFSILV